MANKWLAFNRLNGSWGLTGENFVPLRPEAEKAEQLLNNKNKIIDLLERIHTAHDLHAVFTIKDSPEYQAVAALMLGDGWQARQAMYEFYQVDSPHI